MPRPVQAVLPLELPLCEMSTEKGEKEVLYCKRFIFSDTLLYALRDYGQMTKALLGAIQPSWLLSLSGQMTKAWLGATIPGQITRYHGHIT